MSRKTITSEIMSLRGLNRSPVTKRSSLQLMYEISKTRNVCKAQYRIYAHTKKHGEVVGEAVLAGVNYALSLRRGP